MTPVYFQFCGSLKQKESCGNKEAHNRLDANANNLISPLFVASGIQLGARVAASWGHPGGRGGLWHPLEGRPNFLFKLPDTPLCRKIMHKSVWKCYFVWTSTTSLLSADCFKPESLPWIWRLTTESQLGYFVCRCCRSNETKVTVVFMSHEMVILLILCGPCCSGFVLVYFVLWLRIVFRSPRECLSTQKMMKWVTESGSGWFLWIGRDSCMCCPGIVWPSW